MKRARLKYVYQKREEAEFAKRNKKLESEKNTNNEGTETDSSDSSDDTDYSEEEREALRDSSNNRIDEKMKAELAQVVQKIIPDEKGSQRRKLRSALTKVLFDNHDVDLEKGEYDEEQDSRKVEIKPSKEEVKSIKEDKRKKEADAKILLNHITIDDIYTNTKRKQDFETLPLSVLRKYTRQPKYKIEGTWNYLFNGHGACDWIRDPHDTTRRHVLVGHGTKLSKS
jgi:hypothetical protein